MVTIEEARAILIEQFSSIDNFSLENKSEEETLKLAGTLALIEYKKLFNELLSAKQILSYYINQIKNIQYYTIETLMDYEYAIDVLTTNIKSPVVPDRLNVTDLMAIQSVIDLNPMIELVYPDTVKDKLNQVNSIQDNVQTINPNLDLVIEYALDLNKVLQFPQDMKTNFCKMILDFKLDSLKKISESRYEDIIEPLLTFEETLYILEVPIILAKMTIFETILLSDELFNFSRNDLSIQSDTTKIGSVYFTDELYINSDGDILYNRMLPNDKLVIFKRLKFKFAKFLGF